MSSAPIIGADDVIGVDVIGDDVIGVDVSVVGVVIGADVEIGAVYILESLSVFSTFLGIGYITAFMHSTPRE